MGGVGILIWGLSLLHSSEIALFVKNVIPVTASWACPSGGTGYLSTSLGTNPEF